MYEKQKSTETENAKQGCFFTHGESPRLKDVRQAEERVTISALRVRRRASPPRLAKTEVITENAEAGKLLVARWEFEVSPRNKWAQQKIDQKKNVKLRGCAEQRDSHLAPPCLGHANHTSAFSLSHLGALGEGFTAGRDNLLRCVYDLDLDREQNCLDAERWTTPTISQA